MTGPAMTERIASAAVAAAGADRPDAFVSYAREDKDWVLGKPCQALVAHGKDVWIDVEDIRGGASEWWPVVEEGIESAKVMIFVPTPDSVASKVCGRELQRAVDLNKDGWANRRTGSTSSHRGAAVHDGRQWIVKSSWRDGDLGPALAAWTRSR